MIIDVIRERIGKSAAVQDFLEKGEGDGNFIFQGVSGSLKSILLSLLVEMKGGMNVIFVPYRKTALILRDDFE